MNKVILMGRLTKDPETSTTQSGTVLCRFSIAVNRQFARQGEERKADFFNIVAWNKTAEFCGKYFVKGQQVAVVGHLENGQWDDKQGVRHYATDVIAEDVYFADSKRDSGSSYNAAPPQAFQGGAKPQQTNNSNSFGAVEGGDGFFPLDDEDMPF